MYIKQKPKRIYVPKSIDVKKTVETFGHNPQYLKLNSCKLVVCYCVKCGCERIKKLVEARRNKLCFMCSNQLNANTNVKIRTHKIRKNWEKNGHPRLGKKHTAESKAKMSKALTGRVCSEETRQKLSAVLTGTLNPFYGQKHTEASLEKMRAASQKNVRRGKNSNLYGKHHHSKGAWYIKNDLKIWMRSSWEIKFAFYLDEQNIVWMYERLRFPITYEYEGRLCEGTYCPDFYLPDWDKYVEVKGYWRDDAKVKYQAFIKQYPELTIDLYTKKELENVGINLR